MAPKQIAPKQLTAFRLEPATLAAVDAHATRNGTDRSSVLRAAVAEHLARHGIEVPGS